MTRASRTMQSGLEPRPTGGISHLTVLRNNELSLLCLPSGELDSRDEPSAGLYYHDARHLSRFTLRLNGELLLVLDADERGDSLSATLTNPSYETPDGRAIPAQTILVRRSRTVSDCLAESLIVSNYGRAPVQLELTMAIEADFADIFVIRGHKRSSPVPPVGVEHEGDRLSFRYMGQDEQLRALTCRFEPAPTTFTPDGASFAFTLDPGGSYAVDVTLRVDDSAREVHAADELEAMGAAAQTWLKGLTSVETDNSQLNAVLERCLLDIRSLQSKHGETPFIAAGVPWFDAAFGRDSLITGIEMLAFTREPLRTAIVMLAEHQAQKRDSARDAEPGKIAHELRQGELANIDEVPFGAYYGSIDSTPLFLIGCLEYLSWTNDAATLRECWQAIEAAAGWCQKRAAGHPLHMLAYDRESANGLEHQGWKDSEDGICQTDGTPVKPPIALIEVQAYLAAAYHAYAELCRRLEREPAFDTQLGVRDAVYHLATRFFGEEGAAVCLDEDLAPVFCPTSNPGHVLWVGACGQANATRIGERLMQPDMFSGWGVRTLAAGIPAYNPLGYHIGSIWPHDNAIILAGFRRYGLVNEVAQLGAAMIEAAMAFPDRRIPELFSGDARDNRPVPTPYPVASRPQAWSAASLPYAMVSMLGIGITPEGSLAITRPVLPDWLNLVVVRGLRFGDSCVDLLFRCDAGHVSVEVDHRSGEGAVVLSREWPVPPLTAQYEVGGPVIPSAAN